MAGSLLKNRGALLESVSAEGVSANEHRWMQNQRRRLHQPHRYAMWTAGSQIEGPDLINPRSSLNRKTRDQRLGLKRGETLSVL